MRATDAQVAFWDAAAPDAEFTLPVDVDLLRREVGEDARVLDFGCGYGRTLAQLSAAGFRRLCGIDVSPAMVERARRRVPDAHLGVHRGLPTPHPDGAFDAVLLVAVLTCIPADADQQALVRELGRLLRPGGMLYVCDFMIRSDERNLERYAQHAREYGRYGVFRLDGGPPLRHHDTRWIRSLFRGLADLEITTFEAHTMRGNPATGVRVVGRAE